MHEIKIPHNVISIPYQCESISESNKNYSQLARGEEENPKMLRSFSFLAYLCCVIYSILQQRKKSSNQITIDDETELIVEKSPLDFLRKRTKGAREKMIRICRSIALRRSIDK